MDDDDEEMQPKRSEAGGGYRGRVPSRPYVIFIIDDGGTDDG